MIIYSILSVIVLKKFKKELDRIAIVLITTYWIAFMIRSLIWIAILIDNTFAIINFLEVIVLFDASMMMII